MVCCGRLAIGLFVGHAFQPASRLGEPSKIIGRTKMIGPVFTLLLTHYVWAAPAPWMRNLPSPRRFQSRAASKVSPPTTSSIS